MGQSELGGASYLGGDFATDNTRPATTGHATGGDSLNLNRKGSRRQEVAQRHGLSLAGTKASPVEGSGAGAGRPPVLGQQKSANHGIFLGGGVVQDPPST
jgi:hypothetical protein